VASRVQLALVQPPGGASGRGAREPRVLDHLGQLGVAQFRHVLPPQQHRQVAVEVRSGEERRVRVLDHRPLLGLVGDPEDDHVVVPLPRHRVDRVRPRVAEEDKRLPADLVDGRLPGLAGPLGDMRHRQRELVHVRDGGGPAIRGDHGPSIERPRQPAAGLRGSRQRPFRVDGVGDRSPSHLPIAWVTGAGSGRWRRRQDRPPVNDASDIPYRGQRRRRQVAVRVDGVGDRVRVTLDDAMPDRHFQKCRSGIGRYGIAAQRRLGGARFAGARVSAGAAGPAGF
jgi:hypothetical protein